MKKEFLYGLILVTLYLLIMYILPEWKLIERFEEETRPNQLLKPFINPTDSLVALTGTVTDTLRASDIILTPMRVLNDLNTDTDPKICMDIKKPDGGNRLTDAEKDILKKHANMSESQVNNLQELCIDKTMIDNANNLNKEYGEMLNQLYTIENTVQDVNGWATGTYLDSSDPQKNTLLQYLNDNFYNKDQISTKTQADSEYESNISGTPLTQSLADTMYVKLSDLGGVAPLTESEGDSLYQRKIPGIEYMTEADALGKYLRLHTTRSESDKTPYATRSYLDTKIAEYDAKIAAAQTSLTSQFNVKNPSPLDSASAAASKTTLSDAASSSVGTEPFIGYEDIIVPNNEYQYMLLN